MKSKLLRNQSDGSGKHGRERIDWSEIKSKKFVKFDVDEDEETGDEIVGDKWEKVGEFCENEYGGGGGRSDEIESGKNGDW